MMDITRKGAGKMMTREERAARKAERRASAERIAQVQRGDETMTKKVKAIVQRDPVHGAPIGSYDVTYYRVSRSGEVTRRADTDSSAPLAYVERVARELRANEAMVAVCRSQPGTIRAYGSAHTRAAMADGAS
jgi:hypothetical protein